MGFINEWVSEEDVEKYGMWERNNAFYLGNGGENWTVDKERDIYLRYLRAGFGNECSDDYYFDFYWKGYLCYVHLGRDGGGVNNAPQWAIWTLKSFYSSDDLGSNRAQALEDLKAAFIARRGGGVLSTCTEYTVDFKNFN